MSVRPARTRLLVLGAALLCQFVPWGLNPLAQDISWLALLLLSFEGVGALLMWRTRTPADVGLHVAVGLSAMVVAGGPLVAWRCADTHTCTGLVACGLIAQVSSLRIPRTPRAVAEGWWGSARDVAALLVLCFFVASALTQWRMHPYDDALAYTPLVKKLLAVGHLDEPFSLRRLSGLGGHSFLTALVHTRVSLSHAFACDRGLCVVALALLVRWSAQSARTGAYLVVLVAVCSVFGGSGFSFFSGMLLLCASWLLARHMAATRSLSASAVQALPVAALCSLRQFDMAFVAAWFCFRWLYALKKGRPAFAPLAGVTLLSALFVAPWCYVSVRSAGTFLFPLLHGNATSRVMPLDRIPSLGASVLNLVDVLTSTELLCLLPLVAAIALTDVGRPPETPGVFPAAARSSFARAAAATSLALFASMQVGNIGDLGRYLFPFALACLLLVPLRLQDIREERAIHAYDWALMLSIAIAVVLAPTRFPGAVDRIVAAMYGPRASTPTAPPEPLQRAQATIPPTAKIAVMVDTPAALDYGRNTIDSLDLPGYASPPPGMPWELGSEAIALYLQAHGYDYLMFQRPQYSSYLLRTASLEVLASSPKKLWQEMAHQTLLANARMAELANVRDVVFEDEGVVALRLRRP